MINNLVVILGCLLIPAGLLFVYLYYRRKGRDKDMPKTIIPLFSPPENTPPYMLGTMKDEQVDREDVVGSIIDLAYRGYIKIKEIKKDKEYEITRLKEDDEKLDDTEREILGAVFNGKSTVSTKDLPYHFPSRYMKITSQIYRKVVEKGYFSRSPQTTIGSYIALGIVLALLGGFSVFCLSTVLTDFLGFLTIFSPGIAIFIVGVSFLIIAKFMPAKTATGSKLFADILGFKMYLHTAERYRLQNLGPEEFEKYLSYAIVFKIEEEWAKKFEGIYEGQPEWFESSTGVYNPFLVSHFARSFSTATVSNMYVPSSSGSSKGGGWSGGGSFGGFSGGGGGGGSSGGW